MTQKNNYFPLILQSVNNYLNKGKAENEKSHFLFGCIRVVGNAVQPSDNFGCQQFKLLIMRLAVFCLTILAALLSCKKDKLDLIAFWECNKSLNLDTTAISNKLVGSWTLSKQRCGDFGETRKASKDVNVTFQSDYTFFVKENSITESQGRWKLKQMGADTWVLDLSATSLYLYGDILFCDNLLLSNANNSDGCANLFKRNN